MTKHPFDHRAAPARRSRLRRYLAVARAQMPTPQSRTAQRAPRPVPGMFAGFARLQRAWRAGSLRRPEHHMR